MSPGEIDRARFLASLKAAGALQFGTFTLASGRTSPYYVDIKRAVTRPDLLRMIAEGMAPFVREADRIAGWVATGCEHLSQRGERIPKFRPDLTGAACEKYSCHR